MLDSDFEGFDEGVEETIEIAAIVEYFTDECEWISGEETAVDRDDFSETDFECRTDEE